MRLLKCALMVIILPSLLLSNAEGSSTFSAGSDSPFSIVVSPDGAYLYAGCTDGTVTKIQLSDRTIDTCYDIGIFGALDLAITSDGQYMYASNAVNGYHTAKIGLSNCSLLTNIPGGVDPGAMAIDANDSLIYITNHWSGFLQIVSIPDNIEITRLYGIGNGAIGICLSPDENYAYVTVRGYGPYPDSGLLKISLTDNQIVGELPNIKGCGIDITPDGQELWTALSDNDYVYIVDASTLLVIDSLHSPDQPTQVRISSDGQYAFVLNQLSNMITTFSVPLRQKLDSAITGQGPNDLALSPDGQKLYVANNLENTITEFALSEITGQITCDGFEQYDVPSGWMANWHGSGNVSGIAVDNTTAATGANSMHMFGILGGCWAAVATRPLQMDLPMEITFSVKNGDEDLYGCNPYRGALGLRTGGPDWWNCPCFAFVLFLENGDVRIPVPSGAVEFTGYPLGVWHHVKCQLINPDDGFLHVKIWINQGYLGEFYWPFESWMTGSAYLDIESLEGTAWFDDICVSEPLIDTLYLPPHKGCLASKDMTSVVLPLKVKNQTEITAINIPLKWNNANLILDSISHVGTATENWSNNHVIKNDSQRIVIGSLDISGSLPILSGWDTTVALLYFRYTGTQCAYDSLSIAFDTTYSDNEQWKLAFGDNSNPPNEFYPEFSSSDALIYTLKPGDVNMNCGVNILDASYLIFYLYKGGVVPNPLFMGDVNCNGNINILDVSYLLAFLYKNGPAPVCCVPGMSLSTPPKQCACVKGERSVPGGTITLTSESGQNALVLRNSIGLSGLELILKATNRETVELKSAIDGIELHWSQNGDEIRAALIDLSGLATIDAGERKIIEVIGDIEIVSVLGADENSNGVSFEIVNQATKEELLPKVYSLEQNRPNPFNPATTIEFSLPRASDVSLEVYNIAGQKIATLVNTRLEAGNHTVNWDSKSTSGEPLASGIYLYRLKADTFVETKKMVLLK